MAGHLDICVLRVVRRQQILGKSSGLQAMAWILCSTAALSPDSRRGATFLLRKPSNGAVGSGHRRGHARIDSASVLP